MLGISKVFHLESQIYSRGRYLLGLTSILLFTIYLATVSASLAAVTQSPAAVTELSSADILQKARPAVVKVIVNDAEGKPLSQGSGVIITADGIVLTAWHVIVEAKSVVVWLSTGKKVAVEGVVGGSEETDYALLKVARTRLPIVPMGDSDKIRQGDRVLTLGAPLGMEASASDGMVSAVREFPDGRKLIQMTAPVSPGSSGGPVLNMRGEVIGIASFVLVDGQNLNFAVPINKVKPSLKAPHKVRVLMETVKAKGDADAQSLFFAGLFALPDDWTAPEAREKIEKALAIFQKAVSKRKDYAQVYCGMACCSGKLGRYQDAVDAYTEAIRLKPEDSLVHYNLGVMCGKLGRYQDAIDTYKDAVRLKPDFAEAHYGLGKAYACLLRHQDAVDSFKETIRLKPDDADAHNNLGVEYGDLGRYQDAVDAYREAIRLKPDLAEAHNNLGGTYERLGRYQDAVDACKKAIRLKPDLSEAHFALGRAYARLRSYPEAVDAFKETIRLKPDDARAHYLLGGLYLSMKNHGGALDEYKILKELNKEFADKLFNLIYP